MHIILFVVFSFCRCETLNENPIKVSIEDAVTKKNRVEIGDFSLMKIKGPSNERGYTVIVPSKPTRSL